ncbi:MAG: periplasmic heavy metal sensor [Thalassobaculum sp.]|uniref:periplasmic heavy metal sensor n=1 Tax=Thalassobaculum sp. TaxID=2022740 RepID=UPI0032EFAFD6
MSNRLRLVSLLLFASLALNLFLGGLMAGRLLDHPPPHGPRPHMERAEREGAAPGWMRRALGPEAGPMLDETWRSRAAEIEPIREALDRSRDAVGAAMEAEPFDPQAYAVALQEMQDLRSRLYPIINEVMTEVVTRLTPEQRRQVVERGREWERRKAGRE